MNERRLVAMSDGPASVRRITKELVEGVSGSRRAIVTAAEPGVVAGIDLLDAGAAPDPAGTWTAVCRDGDRVSTGDSLVEIVGSAWELTVAEDHVLGSLGVAGGFASRGLRLRAGAPADLRIACGGWKKLPPVLKPVLHAALDVAGITPRLIDGDFVYMDKNVVSLLDGIEPAVERGRALDHGPVAVQVIDLEQARRSVLAGCGIVMVDTGAIDDLSRVHDALQEDGTRDQVLLAFAGGVRESGLVEVKAAGADIVDIGRELLDAPLWDLRMEVVSECK